jgi:signal peptidase I
MVLWFVTMDDINTAPGSRLRGLRISWWLVKFLLAALFIAIFVRVLIAQPFLVTGASMEPTLNPNEYLVIDKISHQISELERGDVIIMRYPLDSSVYFVKRVIGLPGETVHVSNGTITVLMKDGTPHVLHEPYLVMPNDDKPDATVTLAQDEYFVLGDNRAHSSDSREWGPLQKKFIVGRAFARLFPFDKIKLLPGEHRFSEE